MVRFLASDRGSNTLETAENRAAGRRSSSTVALRRILWGLGLVALAYVVYQRMRSGGPRPQTDAGSESKSGGREIPIGETAEADESASEDPDADASDSDAGTDREASDDELPGEERSAEEIAERSEEDVHGEPAEPGEMSVDDDIVDEVVDEDEVVEGSERADEDEDQTSGADEASDEDEDQTSGEDEASDEDETADESDSTEET